MRKIKSGWGLYGFAHDDGEIWCTDDWPTDFTLRLVFTWERGSVPVEELQDIEKALQLKTLPAEVELFVRLFSDGMEWAEAKDCSQRLLL